MKCITPMFRVYESGNHKNGHVISREAANFELQHNNNYYREIKEYNKMRGIHWKMEMIPCQHCFACALNKSAEWGTRIMCEAQKYEHNYFVTLTYDNEHLPIAEKLYYKKPIKTEVIGIMGDKYIENDFEIVKYENDGTWTEGTLDTREHDRFINSLRKHFERKGHKGIKYYMCGEYGEENTHRPHLHYILMNVPLDISQFYGFKIDENFKAHWKSKELEKIWKKGRIDIAEVEWSDAAYVARYTAKKLFKTSNKEIYYEHGKLPEFVRMSTRDGGIGNDYYQEHKHEIYKNDEMIARTVKGNVSSVKPPKAWDKKFKKEFPYEFMKIKLSRQKAADRAEKLIQSATDYNDKQMQDIATRRILEKASMLPRPGEWD